MGRKSLLLQLQMIVDELTDEIWILFILLSVKLGSQALVVNCTQLRNTISITISRFLVAVVGGLM